MPRSADAIRRRAEKRNRTLAEQRRADAQDWKKQAERSAASAAEGRANSKKRQKISPKLSSSLSSSQGKAEKDSPIDKSSNIKNVSPSSDERGLDSKERLQVITKPSDNSTSKCKDNGTEEKQNPSTDNSTTTSPLDEPGAWKCSKCGNHNFPSRNYCHSKTCDEKRPEGVFVPPRNNKKQIRHDPATSRKHNWAEQADEEKIARNQLLRKKYLETGGDGMTEDDISRAKLLLERDERKKQKKEMKKMKKKKPSKAEPDKVVKQ